MKENKSFTLIELLVVVAIIGIISSLAFVNVKDSQRKAKDANIIKNLLAVVDAAEFLLGETIQNYDMVCDEADNTLSNTESFNRLESAIKTNNGNKDLKCLESADKREYAVSSPLIYLAGYWCVDSRGVSKNIPSDVIISECP
ncbi:MAG: type II secretion system protein [Candidatus Nealsonbacteria bacterium]|nr:type II secretion system protein [Candidatus Nealsonbacteria bacterium]